MAKEIFTGPIIALGGGVGNMRLPGAAAGGVGAGPIEYSDEIGPSGFWSGIFIPATGAAHAKDKYGPGVIAGIFGAFPIKTVNSAPIAGAGALTTAANAVQGAALPNVTTFNSGRAPIPLTVGGVNTTGIALDCGLDNTGVTFSTGGTVTIPAASTWRYKVGQWIALLNGGAAGLAMYTQITAINKTTGVMNVSPAPAISGSGSVALSNRFNPNTYGNPVPTNIGTSAAAGTARIKIPEVGITRGVGIVGVASGTGGNFLIQGLDTFNVLQTEIIAATAGATTTWGKKTYDVFISATPQFADAHNYTVQTSDLIGLPMSVMSANSIYQVLMAGTAQTTANYTIVPADTTNPATSATGDPRGGIQVTGNGPATAPSTPMTLNGTNVLTVYQILDPLAVAVGSPINPGPLLGVPPG